MCVEPALVASPEDDAPRRPSRQMSREDDDDDAGSTLGTIVNSPFAR